MLRDEAKLRASIASRGRMESMLHVDNLSDSELRNRYYQFLSESHDTLTPDEIEENTATLYNKFNPIYRLKSNDSNNIILAILNYCLDENPPMFIRLLRHEGNTFTRGMAESLLYMVRRENMIKTNSRGEPDDFTTAFAQAMKYLKYDFLYSTSDNEKIMSKLEQSGVPEIERMRLAWELMKYGGFANAINYHFSDLINMGMNDKYTSAILALLDIVEQDEEIRINEAFKDNDAVKNTLELEAEEFLPPGAYNVSLVCQWSNEIKELGPYPHNTEEYKMAEEIVVDVATEKDITGEILDYSVTRLNTMNLYASTDGRCLRNAILKAYNIDIGEITKVSKAIEILKKNNVNFIFRSTLGGKPWAYYKPNRNQDIEMCILTDYTHATCCKEKLIGLNATRILKCMPRERDDTMPLFKSIISEFYKGWLEVNGKIINSAECVYRIIDGYKLDILIDDEWNTLKLDEKSNITTTAIDEILAQTPKADTPKILIDCFHRFYKYVYTNIGLYTTYNKYRNINEVMIDCAIRVCRELIYKANAGKIEFGKSLYNDTEISDDEEIGIAHKRYTKDKQEIRYSNTFWPPFYNKLFDFNVNNEIDKTAFEHDENIVETFNEKYVVFDMNKAYYNGMLRALSECEYSGNRTEFYTWYNIPILPTTNEYKKRNSFAYKPNDYDLVAYQTKKYKIGGFMLYKDFVNYNKNGAALEPIFYYRVMKDGRNAYKKIKLDFVCGKFENGDRLTDTYELFKELSAVKGVYTKLLGTMITKNSSIQTNDEYFTASIDTDYKRMITKNTYIHVYALIEKQKTLLENMMSIKQKYGFLPAAVKADEVIYPKFNYDIEFIKELNMKVKTIEANSRIAIKTNGGGTACFSTATLVKRYIEHNAEINKIVEAYKEMFCFGQAGSGKSYMHRDSNIMGYRRNKCIAIVQNGSLYKDWSEYCITYIAQNLITRYDTIVNANTMIIDEAFLLSDDVLSKLINIANRNHMKIHIIGDPYQFIFNNTYPSIYYNVNEVKYKMENYRNIFDYKDLGIFDAIENNIQINKEIVSTIILGLINSKLINVYTNTQELIDEFGSLDKIAEANVLRLTSYDDKRFQSDYYKNHENIGKILSSQFFRCEQSGGTFTVGSLYKWSDLHPDELDSELSGISKINNEILGCYLSVPTSTGNSEKTIKFIMSPLIKFYATQGKTLKSINIYINDKNKDNGIVRLISKSLRNPRFFYVLISRISLSKSKGLVINKSTILRA